MGGTATLNLTLTSPSGSEPAGLQWSISYAVSEVGAVSAAAGPALTAAGKTLSCAGAAGVYSCLATGLNANIIQNGVVATVSVTLSPTASGTTLNLSNLVGASVSGSGIAITASGSTVTTTGTSPALGLTSLACNPASLNAPATSTCSVSLNASAPSGGAVVSLAADNANVSVPPSVTVSAGLTTATFTATAKSVSSTQTATITASLNGSTQTAALTLVAPSLLSALQCSPASIPAGSSSTCMVSLSQPAPAGGSAVTLASNNPIVSMPASATVVGGASSVSFTAQASSAVTTSQNVTLTASLNGALQYTTVAVVPASSIAALQCSPTNITGGSSSTCTVTLGQPAPSGGSVVGLAVSNPVLSVPASATVAAGATSVTFLAATSTVTTTQNVTLTASLNGASQYAALTVAPPALVSALQCSPASLVGGSSSTCTVTLNAPAPSGGSAVALSRSSSAVLAPASVTVAASATTATFTLNTTSVATTQNVTLTASLNGSSQSATLTVTAAVLVSGLQCSPSSVPGGSSSICTVTLSQPAPAGGSLVALADNNAALSVPTSVTVPAAATTATFTANTHGVTSGQNVTLTASLNGASQTAAVLVLPPVFVSALQCSPADVSAGSSISCTVTLNQAAPAGGSLVALATNNPAIAAPASVMVPAAAATAVFSASVGSVATNQTATITATLNGTSQSAAVSLAAVLVSALSCNPASVPANSKTVCTVALTAAAPTGGSIVSLQSGATVLSVPATVSVPAGSSSTTFTATAGSVTTNQSVALAASLNGGAANTSVTVLAPVMLSSLACNPAMVSSGKSTACSVTLTAAAAAATTVSLSSSSTALSVPSSVTVAAGSSSASFTATAGTITSNQTATVTAAASGNSQTASISLVSALAVSSLQCTSTTLVSAASSTCTITLTNPAPSTVHVAVSSSSPLLTAPTVVAVGSGASIATFQASAGIITASTTAVLRASLNGLSQTVPFNLSAAPAITALSCARTKLAVGASTTCAATLVNVNAATSAQLATSVPTALSVPPQLALQPGAVNASFPVTATATANGWVILSAILSNSIQSTTLTLGTNVTPKAASSVSQITCENTGFVAGNATQCSVELATAAPAGGATVQIMSDNPQILAPGTAQVDQGATATSFVVQSKPSDHDQQANLVATAGDNASAVRLNLTGIRPTALSCTPAVLPAGGTTTCEVHLNAPSDRPVSLSLSSDNTRLKLPAAVHPRPRQSSLTFVAMVDPDAPDQGATLTAAFGSNPVQSGIRITAAASPLLKVPGSQVAKYETPVQFTITASDPTGLPVQLATGTLPRGATFDPSTGLFQWIPDQSQQGTSEITFTATNSRNAGTSRKVSIEVDAGQPALTALQQAATRQSAGACSPGAVATLTGKWLGGNHPGGGAGRASRTGLPLTLAGNGPKVKVNDAYAPVLSATDASVNFVCPALAADTPLQISVETPQGITNTLTAAMADASPGIFSLDHSGSGQGLVTFADSGTLAMPRNPLLDGAPAQPGDELSLLATGLPVSPAAQQQLEVKIGDTYAPVESVEAVSGRAGIYMLRFRLPGAIPFGDAVPVRLELPRADSVWDSNTVTIAIEAVRP